MVDIAVNLQTTLGEIQRAAITAGRDATAIRLVAVSKGQAAEVIEKALLAGQRIFGENRVQEAAAKFGSLRAAYPDIELHFIGPLQTNKAEEAVQLFDAIETIDRPRIAKAIASALSKTGRALKLSIEVNIGSEPQKAGVAPEALGDFLAFCKDDCRLSITGLMCIPPQGKDPEPFFRQLKSLADQYGLPSLSMGMSEDFEIAIKCGATEIRVGRALFGERLKK